MVFYGVLLVNSNTLYLSLSSTLLILILLKFERTSRGVLPRELCHLST